MNLQFISYTKVDNEKYLGVCEVLFDDKILLRYKVIPAKDGKGWFPATASIKATDKYVEAFLIDSRVCQAQIETVIRDGMRKYMSSPKEEEFGDVPF